MKINVASPLCGTQKKFELGDEKKLQLLYEKKVSQEFDGELLGDEFKGYVLKIVGGCDKDGFPMKQGVLSNSRVKLLINRGDLGFQSWRGRSGERRRKSVRGCIVGPDIAVLNTIIVQEGEEKVEGLTDHTVPRRVGPKRASKIRKLFNLSKKDDVRKFVIRKNLPATEKKKARSKAPKIQRLVTPITLERRRRKRAVIRKQRAKSLEERLSFLKMIKRRRSLRAIAKKNRAARTRLGLRLKELNQIATKKSQVKRAKLQAENKPEKKEKKTEKKAKAEKPKAEKKEKPEPAPKAAKTEKKEKPEKKESKKPAPKKQKVAAKKSSK